MGIVLYQEPMDKRLENAAFFEFFRKYFEEEHKNDPPVLDDDTWDIAVRNAEYVEKVYTEYIKQVHHEITDVENERDVKELFQVAGGFHDACIDSLRFVDDTVHAVFSVFYDVKLEMWFRGDASFSSGRRLPDDYFGWQSASLIVENEYFYLVDELGMTAKDLHDPYCWFRGRKLSYRVITNQ